MDDHPHADAHLPAAHAVAGPPVASWAATMRSCVAALWRDRVHYLANAGAAAILVAAVGPIPALLELDPLSAEALRFVAMMVFAERLFGGEVRDYVVAAWMSWALVQATWHASTLHTAAAYTVFSRELVVFVVGALLVRWMKTFEPDLVTEEMSAEQLRLASSRSVPLGEAAAAMPYLAEGVDLLERRLRSSSLHTVLGLPDDLDLRQELAHVRVRAASLNVLTNLLFSASYLPFNRTLQVNPRARTPRVVAHELLHALHHSAIRRALTRSDLEVVLSRLDKDRTAAFIDDMIDRTRAWLDDHPGAPPTDAVRWDGADLIFYYKLEDKAPMEAVGSYFDGQGWGSIARYLEKLAYYFALPFAVLAGMDRRNGIFQSFAGYLNKSYVEDMRARGLVRALLEPRGP